MSDETVSVADEVTPPGKGKPRSQAAKKANVKNAKNPKEASGPTVKYKAKDKNVSKFADLIKQIADKNRVAILLNLAQGSMNVTDICKVLSMTQPAISHHLALMRASEIVEADRQGKNNFYSLAAKGKSLAKFAKSAMESDE